MKNHKNQDPFDAQSLTRTIRVNGHTFTVNMDGYVETAEFGHLGHIVDCQEFAAMIYDLKDIFENPSEI